MSTKNPKIGIDTKIPLARGAIQRFPMALREVARVSHMGCIKYDAPEGSMDYLQGDDAVGVFDDAETRHMNAEAIEGPINIEKGGSLPEEGIAVLHAAQRAWNALASLEKKLRVWKEMGYDVDAMLANAPNDEAALKHKRIIETEINDSLSSM